MSTAKIVSFRLGGPDGVSVEAAKWATALTRLGWQVRTVAGAGVADTLVEGLGLAEQDQGGPDRDELGAALQGADLVIVENVCSLPLNRAAAACVTDVLRGRPAVLHHHDLPWQRERFATTDYEIPDDPAWRHVTINDLSSDELAALGIKATTIRNAFDVDAPAGDREGTRSSLGIVPDERLVMQPTRAIARKNIPAAVALAEAVDATYWLLGPAEEGYDEQLDGILAGARQRGMRAIHGVRDTPAATDVAQAYAAADLVAFPSTWEGFGNPVIESAIHRRPLAIGDYPVLRELATFGLRWLDASDHESVRRWFAHPDARLLEENRRVAEQWFSLDALGAALAELLADLDRP